MGLGGGDRKPPVLCIKLIWLLKSAELNCLGAVLLNGEIHWSVSCFFGKYYFYLIVND